MVLVSPGWLSQQQFMKKCAINGTGVFLGSCKWLYRPFYGVRLCSSSYYCGATDKRENSPKLSSSSKTHVKSHVRGLYFNMTRTPLYKKQNDCVSGWRDTGALRNCGIRYYSYQPGSVNPAPGSAAQSGLFSAFSDSSPVLTTQELLLKFHDLSGLSWWSTIILSTIILRTCITLPLALYQHYIIAKVENLKLEMDEIVKELKRETNLAVQKFNWTEKYARAIYNRSLRKQWNKLIIRDNCHPAKAGFLILVQIPMWVSLSLAIRNLVFMLPHPDAGAQLTFLELSGGGALWFDNLLVPDETLLLPIIFGFSNLAIVELQTLSRIREPTKGQKIVTNLFRGISLFMIPVAASVPSSLTLYWTTSSIVGLMQNLLILSPKVRKFCHIPPCASVPENPYTYIAAKLRARFWH